MDSKTKVVVYTVIAVVSMVCMTTAGIFIDADKWAKLAHWITDPATGTALVFLVGLVGAAIGRARHMPVSLLVLALLGASVTGCGLSQFQRNTLAIEVVADATIGADDAIDAAVRADLHNTCPTLAEPCVGTVRANWTAADTAVNDVADALNVWRRALIAARQAGSDPTAAAITAAGAVATAYTALHDLLAQLGVTIPPLPAEVTALLGGAS